MNTTQRLIDLSDSVEFSEFLGTPHLFRRVAEKILKYPKPTVDHFLSKLSVVEDLSVWRFIRDSYEYKTGTSTIYCEQVEDSDHSDGVTFVNVTPYYTKHPLTVEAWRELIQDAIDTTCPSLVEYPEGEYLRESGTSNKIIYKMYRIRKYPDIGYLFKHSCSEGVTTVRLYTEKDGVIYYLPSSMYSKSSGRYNKMTDSYYPESLKLMILAVSSDNVEDLMTSVYLKREELNLDTELSLEELQTLLTACQLEIPEELKSLYTDQVISADDTQVSDFLWRCTNFKVKLSQVLDSFKKGTPVYPEVREFLGTLLCTPTMSERLCKR